MAHGLLQDFRHALRLLWKSPGFTAAATLSLAIGVGANAAIFSLVNALFLVPLPVAEPARVVAVYTSDFSGPAFGNSSFPDFVDFRDRGGVFESLTAFGLQPFALRTGSEPARVWGEVVSGEYFLALGISTSRGRVLTPADDRPSEAPAVVISHALWQRRFAGDEAVLGREVTLSGVPFTVVGVAREGFSGLTRGLAAEVWVPLATKPRLSVGTSDPLARGSRFLTVLGRLRPGTELAEAQARLDVLAGQLRVGNPSEWSDLAGRTRRISLLRESAARVLPDAQSAVASFSALLALVVGLVLLIACANVANLMLARAATRRREIAVRISLGASRGRLLRQFLAEGLLVSGLGGGLGALFALWGAEALTALRPALPLPLHLSLSPDLRVLGFGLGLTLVTGVLLGLAPALQASRPDVVPALKDEGLSVKSGARGHRLRRGFVALQLALTLVLLAGASLLLRGLERATALSPGFDPEGVLLLPVDLGLAGYDEVRTTALVEALAERGPRLPGVRAAALVVSLPLDPLQISRRGIVVEGYQARPGEDMELHFGVVGPGFFESLAIPIPRGRAFTPSDRGGAPGVAIVNETFARRFWPGQDPLRHSISVQGDEGPWLAVVGVARDTKYASLAEEPRPYFYLPVLQDYRYARESAEFVPAWLVLRTSHDKAAADAAVRATLQGLDARLPVYPTRTMTDHLGVSVLPSRIAGTLFAGFGLLGIGLASLGLYGIVTFAVSQRTQEIGVRLALGASRGDILALVVGDGLRPVAIGLATGTLLAAALAQALRSLLYGLSPFDPLTFVLVPTLLAGVALAACALPARRATRVDPAHSLRCE